MHGDTKKNLRYDFLPDTTNHTGNTEYNDPDERLENDDIRTNVPNHTNNDTSDDPNNPPPNGDNSKESDNQNDNTNEAESLKFTIHTIR